MEDWWNDAGGKSEILQKKKHIAVPLWTPQIPHGLT
jgi:hypothetical protein